MKSGAIIHNLIQVMLTLVILAVLVLACSARPASAGKPGPEGPAGETAPRRDQAAAHSVSLGLWPDFKI